MVLAVYGVVAALQPIPEFGWVYAAYRGVFIALSLAWGVVLDGFAPTATTYWVPRYAWQVCWSWSSSIRRSAGES